MLPVPPVALWARGEGWSSPRRKLGTGGSAPLGACTGVTQLRPPPCAVQSLRRGACLFPDEVPVGDGVDMPLGAQARRKHVLLRCATVSSVVRRTPMHAVPLDRHVPSLRHGREW